MIESVSEKAGAAADLKKARRQKTVADPIKLDRLPPHAPDMEQGVLGCQLLSPNDCVDQVSEKFKGSPLPLYDLRHQIIQSELFAMRDAQIPIDVITLQQRLKDRKTSSPPNLLEQVGGIAYLSQLQDAVPSAANLSYYLDIVLEKFLLRQYIKVCTEVVGRIYDYEGDVDQLADEVEIDILKIHASQTADVVLPKPADLASSVIASIEAAWSNHGEPTGLSTGFHDLDAKTDGLHKGEMIVIAARPSIGKTALAVNIAEHVCLNSNKAVGIFSLEMTAEQLVSRMMASVAKVNIRELKRNSLMAESESPKLVSAAGKIGNAKLFIDDTPGLTIMQLRARARRLMKDHHIELFVVDHLQELHSTVGQKSDNREREIADIASGLKALAKELNVPVLVLSQLNRESEKTGGKPKLSQLRESGAIEQIADVVGLLYEKDGEPDSQAEQDAGQLVNLFIAKQREGERYVTVNFVFLKQFTRFEQASQISDADVPEVPAYYHGANPND